MIPENSDEENRTARILEKFLSTQMFKELDFVLDLPCGFSYWFDGLTVGR